MINSKFFWCLLFLTISISIKAMDLESQSDDKLVRYIYSLSIDTDLKEQLLKLAEKNIDDIEYNEFVDILNEQQIRCSAFMGLIMKVADYRLFPIHYYEHKWLKLFYGKDKEKLAKAKTYWEWHKRTGVIGLPPNWPVALKQCVYYGGCIIGAVGVYLVKDYINLDISIKEKY